MSEKRFAAAVAWSSEPKNNHDRPSDRDLPEGALGVVIRHHRQSAALSRKIGAARRALAPHGVAERGGDEAAGVFDARVLLGGPGEEVIHERARDELRRRVVTLRRSQVLPLLLESSKSLRMRKSASRAAGSFATTAASHTRAGGNGSSSRPPWEGSSPSAGPRLAAEDRVVHGVGVGLDIAPELLGTSRRPRRWCAWPETRRRRGPCRRVPRKSDPCGKPAAGEQSSGAECTRRWHRSTGRRPSLSPPWPSRRRCTRAGAEVLGVTAHRAVVDRELTSAAIIRACRWKERPQRYFCTITCAIIDGARMPRGNSSLGIAAVTIAIVGSSSAPGPGSGAVLYFARATTTRTGPPAAMLHLEGSPRSRCARRWPSKRGVEDLDALLEADPRPPGCDGLSAWGV